MYKNNTESHSPCVTGKGLQALTCKGSADICKIIMYFFACNWGRVGGGGGPKAPPVSRLRRPYAKFYYFQFPYSYSTMKVYDYQRRKRSSKGRKRPEKRVFGVPSATIY